MIRLSFSELVYNITLFYSKRDIMGYSAEQQNQNSDSYTDVESCIRNLSAHLFLRDSLTFKKSLDHS